MTHLAGCPLVVAPFFHLAIDWHRRLLVGEGVDLAGQGYVARGPWHPPDDRELGLLVPTEALPNAEECLCVFNLPKHLLSVWWRILERSRTFSVGGLEGFEDYVAKLAEFLAYKNLAVPEGAVFELVVSSPGSCSIQRGEAISGLTFGWVKESLLEVKDDANWPRLLGGLNLGEEPISLVFINLTIPEIIAQLHGRQPRPPLPNTLGELAECFLTLCPDYQPVRLRIEPGEGFRLPTPGILVDACTLESTEPAVLLCIARKK